MRLNFLRLLFDFGLVVLIWMVQLVVYPSFKNFEPENLLIWHTTYMQRITFIVLPLMVGQLTITVFQLRRKRSVYSVGSFATIILILILTFTIFVPIHSEIASGDFNMATLKELVTKNWFRTVLWSFLYLLSLNQFFKTKPFQF